MWRRAKPPVEWTRGLPCTGRRDATGRLVAVGPACLILRFHGQEASPARQLTSAALRNCAGAAFNSAPNSKPRPVPRIPVNIRVSGLDS